MRERKGAFGVVFQDVLRNPSITPEAKCIYAYLSSMAGSNDECYPSRGLMAAELGIGIHRLDKHLSILVGAGVVKKIRLTDGNLKSKNIYKVTHEIEVRNDLNTILEKIDCRSSENRNIESRYIENRHYENKDTNNNSYNNNSINNNNINTNCASDNAPKASRSEINEFFESIWSLYPNKKGKGQVSDAKKKKLYAIGYDEISRAIDRYKDGLSQDGWRQPQNGSTFFNSGYVDYLDANYKADGQPGSRYDPLKDVPQETIDAIIRNASQPREYDPDGDPFQ